MILILKGFFSITRSYCAVERWCYKTDSVTPQHSGTDFEAHDRREVSSAASQQRSSPSLAETLLQGQGDSSSKCVRAVEDWRKIKPATVPKNQEQCRERQAQDIQKAKATPYQGRPVDYEMHKPVRESLNAYLAATH